MKPIPLTEEALVLRTDFTNQAAWERIAAAVQKPVGFFRFRANLNFLDDPAYSGITKEQLLELIPKDYNHSFIMVVDAFTIARADHPLLILDLYGEVGNEFRAIPSQIQGIENNLSIANMDFEDFSGSVDKDGVFRGFPRG